MDREGLQERLREAELELAVRQLLVSHAERNRRQQATLADLSWLLSIAAGPVGIALAVFFGRLADEWADAAGGHSQEMLELLVERKLAEYELERTRGSRR